MLLNTVCSVSVEATVICAPLTVKVPAVTGEEKPAVPIMTLFKLPSALSALLMLAVLFIWAEVANWVILKLKLPIVAPDAAVATATAEFEVEAARVLYKDEACKA